MPNEQQQRRPDDLVVAVVLVVEEDGDVLAVLERILQVGEELALLLP